MRVTVNNLTSRDAIQAFNGSLMASVVQVGGRMNLINLYSSG